MRITLISGEFWSRYSISLFTSSSDITMDDESIINYNDSNLTKHGGWVLSEGIFHRSYTIRRHILMDLVKCNIKSSTKHSQKTWDKNVDITWALWK